MLLQILIQRLDQVENVQVIISFFIGLDVGFKIFLLDVRRNVIKLNDHGSKCTQKNSLVRFEEAGK